LRKYGVRFGAYHIYLPALLKPAARALASLLWAQKQDNVDMSALSGAQHLAGSGRTSFPVDKSLPRDACRVLGYRQCGERAVRVDILERLADLIRPALSWRETSPGEKPAGAFDGRGFVVTQAMTSLTGSAGEDFASILRALGYRMERRPPLPPKPAPAVVEAAAAEAAPAEAVSAEAAPAEASSETLSEAAAIEAAAATANVVAEEAPVAAGDVNAADASSDAAPAYEDAARAPSATLLPDVAFSAATTADEPAAVEAKPVEGESIEVLAEPTASMETPVPVGADAPQDQSAAEATTETAAAEDAAPVNANAAVATPDVVAAPEPIEVWRPGGRSDERRPRHDRSRHRHQDRPKEGAAPAAAAAGEAGEAAKHERHRRGRRDRGREFRKPGPEAPLDAAAPAADGAPVREPREDKGRPSRERFRGRDKDKGRDTDQQRGKFTGGRDNGGRDKGGRDKGGRDSGPSHRQYATSASPRERERPIDPNSPFAKLAALKDQLTANRKDR